MCCAPPSTPPMPSPGGSSGPSSLAAVGPQSNRKGLRKFSEGAGGGLGGNNTPPSDAASTQDSAAPWCLSQFSPPVLIFHQLFPFFLTTSPISTHHPPFYNIQVPFTPCFMTKEEFLQHPVHSSNKTDSSRWFAKLSLLVYSYLFDLVLSNLKSLSEIIRWARMTRCTKNLASWHD